MSSRDEKPKRKTDKKKPRSYKPKKPQPKVESALSKNERKFVERIAKAEVKRELGNVEKLGRFDKGSALLKLINEKFDFKATSGQATAFPLNTVAYSIFVQCWVDRIIMQTPICVGASAVTPSDLAMFAWMAVILRVRKFGQLTGDTISLIPSFAEDISLPVPLANILAYFGQYTQMDQNFVTSYNLPSGFMNATIGFSQLDPAQTYPFPVYNGGLLYDRMYNGGINELVANRVWTPLTVAEWCNTRLYNVSAQLKLLNIATVPSSSVPKEAPGIEAYCCRGIDQFTANVIPGRVYSLVNPVDWEIATIFSIGRNRVVQQTWRSRSISVPSFEPGFRYGTMSTEHYLAAGVMYLLVSQSQYKAGRIRDVYKIGKSKLGTFAWNVKHISGTQVKTLLAANYVQLQEQIPEFNDQVTAAIGFRQLYAMHVLFCLHLHHRCEFSSPVTQVALRLNGSSAHSATAFYNEGISDGVSLPGALAEFIESLGAVISDGAMVFPMLLNPTNVASQTWLDPTFAGNMIEMSWKGLNYANGQPDFYPFPWNGATVQVPTINTGIFTWDSAFQANYEVIPVSFPYPIQHPQMSINDFVEVWKATTGSQIYNNLSLAMVHTARLKEIRFGEPYQMLSVAATSAFRRIAVSPALTVLSATEKGALGAPNPTPPLYVDAAVVTFVGSSMVMNRAEAVQATILPSNIDAININAATSTFLCKMTSTNSYMMLEEAINRVTQSGLNNTTLTLNHQPSSTTMQRLPGGEIVPVKAKDNASTPSAWDQTVHEIGGRLLPPAIGTAASVACDFIPIIGAFLAPMCGAGASAIASTLLSRSSVTGQHLTESSSSSPTTAALQSVGSGISKFGSALKATDEAVAQAGAIVNRFALAQVKGLDYSRLRA